MIFWYLFSYLRDVKEIRSFVIYLVDRNKLLYSNFPLPVIHNALLNYNRIQHISYHHNSFQNYFQLLKPHFEKIFWHIHLCHFLIARGQILKHDLFHGLQYLAERFENKKNILIHFIQIITTFKIWIKIHYNKFCL